MGALEHAALAETVAAAARQRGATVHVVDGATMADEAAALDAIAAALSFPGYFGRNLDALFDCLTDLSWLPAGEHVLIWSGSEVLHRADQHAYQGICRTLADAVAVRGTTLRVVLTDR